MNLNGKGTEGCVSIMQKRYNNIKDHPPPWMTECDVIRHNLRIPDNINEKIKK